jgi:hypothetical protein
MAHSSSSSDEYLAATLTVVKNLPVGVEISEWLLPVDVVYHRQGQSLWESTFFQDSFMVKSWCTRTLVLESLLLVAGLKIKQPPRL